MPWVSALTATIQPGQSTAQLPVTALNQVWIVAFPFFPEGTVRFFGTALWGRREAAPADAFRAIRYSENVWNNATFVELGNALVSGGFSFRVQSSFGEPLDVQIFRFDP